MKSWILVAVILQLVIIGIKTDQNYNFGDIIEFPKRCGVYSHYVIYVGKGTNGELEDVGQGDNDIFHRRGKGEDEYICEFDKFDEIKEGSEDKEQNYLDGDLPAEDRTSAKIKERIERMKEECGKYRYLTNNCEHLATYVRYNISRSLQKGRVAQCVLRPIDLGQRVVRRIQEILSRSDENNNVPSCRSDPH